MTEKYWCALLCGALLIAMSQGKPSASDDATHANATALLVVDLQVDFVDPTGRMPIARDQIGPVMAAANAAIDSAAAHGLPVIYIGNEYSRWDIFRNLLRHNAALQGTRGAALDPGLTRLATAPYFSKRIADAFSNEALDQFLRSRHIHRVVLCGVYADACLTATARSALRRGLEVTLLSDAVGAASEQSRRAALASLGRAGMTIETAAEFTARLHTGSAATGFPARVAKN